jgi:hypothetical protein
VESAPPLEDLESALAHLPLLNVMVAMVMEYVGCNYRTVVGKRTWRKDKGTFVRHMLVLASGQVMSYAKNDNFLRVWDLDKAGEVRIPVLRGGIMCLAQLDGGRVVAGTGDGLCIMTNTSLNFCRFAEK